jgi:hypothetical protein
MDEETRFRQAVPGSMRAVYAVADHLRAKGYEVQVREVSVRPSRSERKGYGDDEDLLFRAAWETDWRRVEVKGRTRDFPPWPHPTITVDRVKPDTPFADYYVSVNDALDYMAVIDGKTSPYWSRKTIMDYGKGYDMEIWDCPIELVHFIPLRR